jgi:hypothetical protein
VSPAQLSAPACPVSSWPSPASSDCAAAGQCSIYENQNLRLVACGAVIALASYSENVAAMFVAVIGFAIFWQGYNIEVKLNKLLDFYNLKLTDEDYDR